MREQHLDLLAITAGLLVLDVAVLAHWRSRECTMNRTPGTSAAAINNQMIGAMALRQCGDPQKCIFRLTPSAQALRRSVWASGRGQKWPMTTPPINQLR